MISGEKTTINGTTYKVTMLPYKLGHRLLLRLYKVLGPVLAKSISNSPSVTGGLANLDVGSLGPAFGAALETLAEKLTEEDFDFMVDTLAEYTEIHKEDGKVLPLKADMEVRFAGNYAELFKWLGFALKVNYGGFTGERGFGDLLKKLASKAKVSPSQPTSTGASTESPAQSATPAP
jgi:hypothetical protein